MRVFNMNLFSLKTNLQSTNEGMESHQKMSQKAEKLPNGEDHCPISNAVHYQNVDYYRIREGRIQISWEGVKNTQRGVVPRFLGIKRRKYFFFLLLEERKRKKIFYQSQKTPPPQHPKNKKKFYFLFFLLPEEKRRRSTFDEFQNTPHPSRE